MVFTNTWNANFEALPPDTGENISQGANRIRALKNAIRERLAIDHYFAIAGTDADHGEHVQIRFHANLATPANVANKSTLYPQTANGKLELWYKNDANQTVQLTANGALAATASIPANSIMLFYADVAPTGWTIKNTAEWNDITVMLTKGSAAGGGTGGANHATGTWTQPNHNHSNGNLAVTIPITGYGTYSVAYNVGHMSVSTPFNQAEASATPSANVSGVTGNNATANTWRPAAKNFIACEKD